MSSRATLAQLAQLGLDSNALALVPTAKLQAALDSASARIDSALATQFEFPLSPPYPLDIIECECVLASWTALMVQGYNPQGGEGNDNLEKRYLFWENYLTKVSKGELIPQIVDAASADAGATGPTVITASQRGYSERGLVGTSHERPNVGPFSGD